MSTSAPPIYEFGEYRLNATNRMLTNNAGKRIELTGKVFDALVYFLEHPGTVVDRQILLGALWPDTVVEENNLNQTVAALRRAIGHDYIQTVPRRGYQFAAEVQRKSEVSNSGPGRVGRSPVRKSLLTLVAGMLFVGGGYYLWSTSDQAPDALSKPAKIAVLPCDNLSPNADDAYLALSLHQEILEQLGKLNGLLVVSRSSMMQYADDRPPIPEIATLLDATAIMECSVRYSAGRIVVNAQVIDPETDSQLWTGSYPGDLAEVSTVINIQSEIARQVAQSLGIDYLPAEQQKLQRTPTESLDAYAEYLKAKQSISWGGYSLGYSTDDFHLHINRAIKIDPTFALAYSDRALGRLSRLLDALRSHNGAARPDVSDGTLLQMRALARSDATKALDLDPTLGRAHVVLGAVEHLSGDTESAYARFRQAIESSPNDAEILSFVVGFYLRDGQQNEALELLAHIKQLNPVDRDVGFYFYLAGDRGTAVQLLRRLIKLDPTDAFLHGLVGYCQAIDGMVVEAEATLRLAEELYSSESRTGPSTGMLPTLAYAYSRIGLAEDAQRLAKEFMEIASTVSVNPMRWAEIQLALGDTEMAYNTLVGVANRPLPPFVSLELEFVLNSYNDPMFEQDRIVTLRRQLSGETFPR
ncbi:MAG: winged helix-turn-helix domain-containing protein [Pseudomonadota bacterium]